MAGGRTDVFLPMWWVVSIRPRSGTGHSGSGRGTQWPQNHGRHPMVSPAQHVPVRVQLHHRRRMVGHGKQRSAVRVPRQAGETALYTGNVFFCRKLPPFSSGTRFSGKYSVAAPATIRRAPASSAGFCLSKRLRVMVPDVQFIALHAVNDKPEHGQGSGQEAGDKNAGQQQ